MKKTKLGKRQMAVAIAKDVLKQLRAGRFLATRMIYVSGLRELLRDARGRELQDILLQSKPKCEVCALGSAFLSAVRLDDKFVIQSEYINDHEMRERLQEYFTYRELSDIEEVFEKTSEGRYPRLAAMFNRRTPAQVLRFIMKQVIVQKGKFNIKKAEKAVKL